MRISPISVSRKCFNTVWPKEPVPPVISRVALTNIGISLTPLHYFSLLILIRNVENFITNSISCAEALNALKSHKWEQL